MINIDSHNRIRITKGDTASVELPIKTNVSSLSDYTLDFVVSTNVAVNGLEPERRLIKKTMTSSNITNNKVLIEFSPIDTARLKPGKYLYTLKLYTAPSAVETKTISGVQTYSTSYDLEDNYYHFTVGQNEYRIMPNVVQKVGVGNQPTFNIDEKNGVKHFEIGFTDYIIIQDIFTQIDKTEFIVQD